MLTHMVSLSTMRFLVLPHVTLVIEVFRTILAFEGFFIVVNVSVTYKILLITEHFRTQSTLKQFNVRGFLDLFLFIWVGSSKVVFVWKQ